MKDIFATSNFGKIAPWVDLVNSEEWDGFGNFADRLDDPDWIASFLRHWHLHPALAEPVPMAQLRELRKVMRRAVDSAGRSGAPRLSSGEVAQINKSLGVAAKQQLVKDQAGFRLQAVPERAGWDWVISEVTSGFANWLLSDEISRVKICENDECRWLFYDPTKARIKRWCSGKSCGNRMRVRRARAKGSRGKGSG